MGRKATLDCDDIEMVIKLKKEFPRMSNESIGKKYGVCHNCIAKIVAKHLILTYIDRDIPVDESSAI